MPDLQMGTQSGLWGEVRAPSLPSHHRQLSPLPDSPAPLTHTFRTNTPSANCNAHIIEVPPACKYRPWVFPSPLHNCSAHTSSRPLRAGSDCRCSRPSACTFSMHNVTVAHDLTLRRHHPWETSSVPILGWFPPKAASLLCPCIPHQDFLKSSLAEIFGQSCENRTSAREKKAREIQSWSQGNWTALHWISAA